MDFRQFQVADPFGRAWNVEFLWQQNGISIRHADTVDVKFELTSGDARLSKVIALPHPALMALSERAGRPITDSWCSRLAAAHLSEMIRTGDDMDKTLVTATAEMLDRDYASVEQTAPAR